MNQGPIFKGGGYGGHHGGLFGAHLRHHHWTGTTDDVPRTNGVPPIDGGLEKPPSPWRRCANRIKFTFKVLREMWWLRSEEKRNQQAKGGDAK